MAQVRPRRISSARDIRAGLRRLLAADPRLRAVHAVAETVPLRIAAGGLEGLAAIVVSQQISKSAADAIWMRLCARFAPLAPASLLGASDEDLRACGLSRPKIRTLRAVAEACGNGLDLEGLETAPADEAIAAMVAINGIGPWTAEVYLLFCCGHPDIFPAGDLALQNAVRDAFGLDARPSDKALREMAEAWSPWRGVAARLFWSYYRARRDGRDATPV